MSDVFTRHRGLDHEKIGPLQENHWLVKETKTCPACEKRFEAGQFVTLIPIGPGEDPEEREKCREGRYYNAVAVPAHYACVTGIEE